MPRAPYIHVCEYVAKYKSAKRMARLLRSMCRTHHADIAEQIAQNNMRHAREIRALFTK